MANRVKEDEKNEKIIRSLLKLPENKRCINCNSLGPQYVCTTFWTFVCTNCSGIHREFTHRVKSVSMAKFTSQEVSSLKEGGNQHAKDIYFKGLDQQRQSAPDGSNVERLRDFIRHVYVNKRYTNEKNDDKPPKGPMDKNDYSETRSSSGSRSPPYDDAYDRRYSDRSSPGGRSPGFEQGSRNVGNNNKKSPSRPEIVNDWRREDRFGGRKTSEEGSQSPEQVKDFGSASPPVARPVREILGDSVIPLRVGEPPKPVNRTTDASALPKSSASLGSLMSTNEKLPEVKLETAVSLIDFDADLDPPAPSVAVQAPQPTTPQPAAQPAFASNDNWASFDAAPSAPNLNVSQPPPSGNTLDSLLSQLAVTSSVPAQTSTLPSGPLHLDHSVSQNFAPPPNGHSSEQLWNTFPSNVQKSMSAPSLQPLQGVPSGGLHSSEVKPPGRTELPADLFTLTYPSYHTAAAPGWQAGPPHGMHYGMQQYNNPMPYQNVPQQAKSMNPFDFNAGPPSQTQTETLFPSMAPLQGALPPSGMMPSQGVHNHFNIPSQVSGHPSAMPPRYMSPQLPGSMPPSNVSAIGNMSAPYGTQQTYHNPGSPFATSIPMNPPSFQSGGNPFG
ncbi:putative ADP-ribosylation factor GTPase-activating protein AGD14 [Cardamine amara subsp. amara]|uniref:ADP-ribosylation factor GTPase-activating protein AGD14 n=1 Tax=Cardamine amara subsp. amara TaxID=228776 RepID=A0ABD1BS24_CARAN